MQCMFYQYVLKEEKNLIVKFGDDYERYKQRVPSMNLLLGVIRSVKRKIGDQKKLFQNYMHARVVRKHS
jgi:hypothetical protein